MVTPGHTTVATVAEFLCDYLSDSPIWLNSGKRIPGLAVIPKSEV